MHNKMPTSTKTLATTKTTTTTIIVKATMATVRKKDDSKTGLLARWPLCLFFLCPVLCLLVHIFFRCVSFLSFLLSLRSRGTKNQLNVVTHNTFIIQNCNIFCTDYNFWSRQDGPALNEMSPSGDTVFHHKFFLVFFSLFFEVLCIYMSSWCVSTYSFLNHILLCIICLCKHAK